MIKAKKFPEVVLINGDLTDFSSLFQIVNEVQLDEIYNLGAISFVGLSFSQPELTANVTGLGALRMLEVVRKLDMQAHVKFYQASSSEMFGKVSATPQNELTSFHPRSPYGVAKTFAHYTCVNYRESYDMFISAGILFNHEGPNVAMSLLPEKSLRMLQRLHSARLTPFHSGHLTLKEIGLCRRFC